VGGGGGGRYQVMFCFLDMFVKLQKTTVSFVMSVHPSVCLHRTAQLPLDGFS